MIARLHAPQLVADYKHAAAGDACFVFKRRAPAPASKFIQVLIKRFKQNNTGAYEKNHTKVTGTDSFTMPALGRETTSDGQSVLGVTYHLIGSIIHIGTKPTPTTGHYVATVKCNNIWYYCNDNTISVIETARCEEIHSKAYMLFYKLDETAAPQELPGHERDMYYTSPPEGGAVENIESIKYGLAEIAVAFENLNSAALTAIGANPQYKNTIIEMLTQHIFIVPDITTVAANQQLQPLAERFMPKTIEEAKKQLRAKFGILVQP